MNYSILINTCDKFEDCWDPFFKLWSLYWKDCTGKIYLNTEYKDYSYPGLDITVIKGCEKHHIPKNKRATWSQCLKWALEEIDTDIILYMQEDYFLEDHVKNDCIRYFINLLQENPEIPSIQLTRYGIPAIQPTSYPNLYSSDPNFFSYLSCQASLWRKDVLFSLIRDHETAWNFEWWGSKRAKYVGYNFLTINPQWLKEKKEIIPYICTGVIGGKWYRPVVDLFKKHGIIIDYNQRGFYERNRKLTWKERIHIKLSIWRIKSIIEIWRLFLSKEKMVCKIFYFKAKDKLWHELVKRSHKTIFYTYIYRSYWHYLLLSKKEYTPTPEMYFAARPNPGAGIGHQMANWIAGYWWSKQLGLKFAHMSFSTQKWDDFLGFGQDEISVKQLQKQGYKLRRLPHFSENDKASIDFVKRIMASYQGRKIIFWPPQDHGYKDQYGVMEDIQRKFRNAPARKKDNIQYNKDKFNIAIHVRRTVVIGNKVIEETEEVKALRWLSNDYYEKVLRQVLENIKVNKPIAIWIFSTGKPEEFSEFSQYGEVHFCSNMDEYQSFAHLIFADLLITSKSSFSYKPALMNKGVKVCPKNFWHGYPNTKDWILCENDGTFDVQALNVINK